LLSSPFSVISKAYGSSWTESGIEHYMRPIRKAAIGLRDLMEQGVDTTDYEIVKVGNSGNVVVS